MTLGKTWNIFCLDYDDTWNGQDVDEMTQYSSENVAEKSKRNQHYFSLNRNHRNIDQVLGDVGAYMEHHKLKFDSIICFTNDTSMTYPGKKFHKSTNSKLARCRSIRV